MPNVKSNSTATCHHWEQNGSDWVTEMVSDGGHSSVFMGSSEICSIRPLMENLEKGRSLELEVLTVVTWELRWKRVIVYREVEDGGSVSIALTRAKHLVSIRSAGRTQFVRDGAFRFGNDSIRASTWSPALRFYYRLAIR